MMQLSQQNQPKSLDYLRLLIPRMEDPRMDGHVLPFGLPDLDRHLPRGSLALEAVHEILPEKAGDTASAFGFIVALLARMPQSGPILFITSRRALADYGRPHGHGLNALGLDPARIILVEAGDERQTLWAIEEALRSGVPAAVAGAIGREIDLKASQRLQLAARSPGVPLLLLRSAGAEGSSAAVTRWCIGSAEAARDRFGLMTGWLWRVRLARCRNGRLGEWLVEWDHVAHHFRLAAALANSAFSHGTSTSILAARAG
jgi:protein ImuA